MTSLSNTTYNGVPTAKAKQYSSHHKIFLAATLIHKCVYIYIYIRLNSINVHISNI